MKLNSKKTTFKKQVKANEQSRGVENNDGIQLNAAETSSEPSVIVIQYYVSGASDTDDSMAIDIPCTSIPSPISESHEISHETISDGRSDSDKTENSTPPIKPLNNIIRGTRNLSKTNTVNGTKSRSNDRHANKKKNPEEKVYLWCLEDDCNPKENVGNLEIKYVSIDEI